MRSFAFGKPAMSSSFPIAPQRHYVRPLPNCSLQAPGQYDLAQFLKTRDGNVGGAACGQGFQLGSGGAQYRVRRENDGSFDKVLQFPNVSGPAISHQRIHRLRGDFVDSLVHSTSVELGEMPNQFRNALRTLPQCRNVDRKYLQSVIYGPREE